MEEIKKHSINAKKGNRKQRVNLITMLFLLVGLALVAWMKADQQLYIAYVIGISGSGFSFMWGNSQEHKFNANKPEEKVNN